MREKRGILKEVQKSKNKWCGRKRKRNVAWLWEVWSEAILRKGDTMDQEKERGKRKERKTGRGGRERIVVRDNGN